MKALIIEVYKNDKQTEFLQRATVRQKELYIGREKNNQLVILDPNVSKIHARVTHEDGKFYLEDLQSSNGTFLEGEKIQKKEIKGGESGAIGFVPVSFKLESTANDSTLIGREAPKSEQGTVLPTDLNLPKLSYEEGGQKKDFVLVESVVTIGRGEDCKLCLNDESVSRNHAEIHKTGPEIVLKCVSEKNVVMVNGKIYSEKKLKDGDQIRLGYVELNFDAGSIAYGKDDLALAKASETSPQISSPAMVEKVQPKSWAMGALFILILSLAAYFQFFHQSRDVLLLTQGLEAKGKRHFDKAEKFFQQVMEGSPGTQGYERALKELTQLYIVVGDEESLLKAIRLPFSNQQDQARENLLEIYKQKSFGMLAEENYFEAKQFLKGKAAQKELGGYANRLSEFAAKIFYDHGVQAKNGEKLSKAKEMFILAEDFENTRHSLEAKKLLTETETRIKAQEEEARKEAEMRKKNLKEFSTKAQTYYKKKRYFRKSGEDAFHYFQKVLESDPTNQVARDGIKKIKESTIANARKKLSRKDWRRARELFFSYLEVVPGNEEALKGIKTCNKNLKAVKKIRKPKKNVPDLNQFFKEGIE